ncbi:MAG: zinc ribbon domain-containing protein, partial [Candidatus Krumholzibacteria bacterium]|nr:zinc ribbon domain-containing protein [Candidatus Krumholzibacteria bacterium]
MPVFEYICSKCGSEFEELVRSPDEDVRCPDCGSREVEKLFSPFARSCKGCNESSG